MAAAIPRHLLETLVNCPACSQRYIEPRVLPACGHTVCTPCLENEWQTTTTTTNGHSETNGSHDHPSHYCPIVSCRKAICSSIDDIHNLPINQTVVDLVQSCTFHVEATGQCQVCNQAPSFVKCSHCSSLVCFECGHRHRRDALTTLTTDLDNLEREHSTMNNLVSTAREKLTESSQKSLNTIREHFTRLIDELRQTQITDEENIERQLLITNHQLDLLVDEHKQRVDQIQNTLQDLRTNMTDWSTIEQFKQIRAKLTHVQEDIREANEIFLEHMPEMKIIDYNDDENMKQKKIDNNKRTKQIDSPSQTDDLMIINSKQNQQSARLNQPLDDSSSTASSSTNNDPIKISTPTSRRTTKKHLNSNGQSSTHHVPEPLPHNIVNHHHRSHPPISGNLLPKTISNSIADLSLSNHHNKIRISSNALFGSKLDGCNVESYKKIPLSQSFDWGMLAVTNTDLILLYNKDKSSLVIFDANGHENERIQWSDGEIKDLCIYHDDSIVIIGEHKQPSKPIECKLYVCNLSRKQLERERVVERGLNCQRITSDEQLIFYGSEKGCNKSKISVFDHELQLQITFEAGVEIRGLAVDNQCCYILGKRREREPGRYFLEKRQKNGQLVRRIDLYELNVDNMNRLIIDPISRGVIVTDGGNKKIWAIGPEGEKKSVQYRPWPWSVAFLTTDTLLILHAGCLSFHSAGHNKPLPQISNGTKTRNVIANTDK